MKIQQDNINGLVSFCDSVEDGATDITSIENWSIYLCNLRKDFIYIREQIQILIIIKAGSDFSTWSSLTNAEKDIACAYICAPTSLRVSHVGEPQDILNWNAIIEPMQFAREARVTASKKYISYELITADVNDVDTETEEKVRGYVFANKKDLIQWITNEVGTTYENNGFMQKTYFIEEIKNKLVDIIKNGNY